MVDEYEGVVGGARVIDNGTVAVTIRDPDRPSRMWPLQLLRKSDGLPVTCPVEALGHDERGFYYRHGIGQVIRLAKSGHARLGLIGLFCPHIEFLYAWRPRYVHRKVAGQRVREINGWVAIAVADELMQACYRVGPISDGDQQAPPRTSAMSS